MTDKVQIEKDLTKKELEYIERVLKTDNGFAMDPEQIAKVGKGDTMGVSMVMLVAHTKALEKIIGFYDGKTREIMLDFVRDTAKDGALTKYGEVSFLEKFAATREGKE